MLNSAVDGAKLGRGEKLGALKRLDAERRRPARVGSGPSVEAVTAQERREAAAARP